MKPQRCQLPLRRQAAYTLIEILIALFIFAIVSTIVVMALQNMMRVRERLQTQSEQLAAMQKALTIIERDIQQNINRRIRVETGRQEPATWLTQTKNTPTLTLSRAGVTHPLAGKHRSSVQRVRYRLDNQQLIREFWADVDRRDNTPPTQMVLLDAVTALQWRAVDARHQFFDLWPPTGHIAEPPSAIELTLTVQGWGEITRLVRTPGGYVNG